jgi:hypothetical protein
MFLRWCSGGTYLFDKDFKMKRGAWVVGVCAAREWKANIVIF